MKKTVFLYLGLASMASLWCYAETSADPSLARPFESTALQTEYRASLSASERQAGLALVWSETRYNFANFDLVPELDWDARYLDFIPKVESAASAEAYYRLLQEFVAGLKDGHSNVFPPPELRDRFYGRPPIYTTLLEGRVMIYLVDSRRLIDAGIEGGVEILEIDGLPVQEYAKTRVSPFSSASTPQDLEVRSFTYGLLQGPKDVPVRLRIVDRDGKVSDHSVPRDGYLPEDDIEPPPELFSWRMLDDGIALIDVRSFNDAKVLQEFREAYSELATAKAWIFDVRKNGGGNSGNGWGMLAHLSEQPLRTNNWKTRLYRPAYRAWGSDEAWLWHEGGDSQIEPADVEKFQGPVMVLSSARTYSAAEDFLVAFRHLDRGLIIGQSSGGSTGQPLRVDLPGGGSFRICAKRDSYVDGTGFVGIGVEPDVPIEPTVEDLRAGRDPELQRAIEEIKTRL